MTNTVISNEENRILDYGTNHRLFWPGACGHCKGDLQLCEDEVGTYRKCVACSRTSPEGLGLAAVNPFVYRGETPLPVAA